MTSSKLIAVLGATGNQGGSVVDTFLNKGWRVRAISRNTSSSKAQALSSKGAEVVQADLDDPATLAPAFEGAHVVFVVSDFWGIYGDPSNSNKVSEGQWLTEWVGQKELQQLKNSADVASKTKSLEQFIISSLPSARGLHDGKYEHLYHFDCKADSERYVKQLYPELWSKTSVYCPGFFLTNFTQNPIMKASKAPNGTYKFATCMDPECSLKLVAAEDDSGPFVLAMVEQGPGIKVAGYRDILTLKQFVDAFAEVTGAPTELVTLPKGEHAVPLPEDIKIELDENWEYLHKVGYFDVEDDVLQPKDLENPPQLGSVVDYLRKQHGLSLLL